MMSNNNPINDGGLAFPDPARVTGHCGEVGMTLLDYFAAKAMQAAIAGGIRAENEQDLVDKVLPEVARLSYVTADAMLRAKSKYHDGGS